MTGRMRRVFFSAAAFPAFLMAAGWAQAETPWLEDGRSGKYLGSLNANPYDPESVNNPHGRYGSRYSQDSINNPFGQYGSPYSSDSANNPYATNPPVIRGPGQRER